MTHTKIKFLYLLYIPIIIFIAILVLRIKNISTAPIGKQQYTTRIKEESTAFAKSKLSKSDKYILVNHQIIETITVGRHLKDYHESIQCKKEKLNSKIRLYELMSDEHTIDFVRDPKYEKRIKRDKPAILKEAYYKLEMYQLMRKRMDEIITADSNQVFCYLVSHDFKYTKDNSDTIFSKNFLLFNKYGQLILAKEGDSISKEEFENSFGKQYKI